MTIGEDRVRISFNPSSDSAVDDIKRVSASLIDEIHSLPSPLDLDKMSEFRRLQALAMTAYEEAAMWAVKAATLK